MFKLMGKIIFTLLGSKNCLSEPMDIPPKMIIIDTVFS